MMTSVGSERSRVIRDKPQIPVAQTQPQKPPVQATAEQIRLAQMIYDKSDKDFEDKVKQLMEVTGKNQDECIVALHDCNGDLTRAINILLEGNSDTTSWETVGKKKSLGKDGSENKENREKRGSDRETSRGRGSFIRRGRGGSRGREFRVEENGVDNIPSERFSDRSRRGRGRGFGGRGRGRGGGGRFSSQGIGTFNPADYTDSSAVDGFGMKADVWDTHDSDDGTGAWRNSVEEWITEDWNEDLSETKVFTASSTQSLNSHITPGQSIDLVSLLQKPAPGSPAMEPNSFETPQQQSFTQALIFTNSQHNPQMTTGMVSSSSMSPYSPQSLSSVLGPGFEDLGTPKVTNSTCSPILDQFKPSSLEQLDVQTIQQNSSSSSWDIKPSAAQASVLSQFDFKSQPEPSPVLSQLTQRQQQVQTSPAPPPGLEPFSQLKLRSQSPAESIETASKILQLPSVSLDSSTTCVQQTHQKQIKQQKRRIPQVSKIPASAVEMPGSADISGLNVQFGALQFGSDPSLCELGAASSSDSVIETQSILYSKPVSCTLTTSLTISSTIQEPTYCSAVTTTSSITSSSQSISTTAASSYDPSTVHRRLSYQNSLTASSQNEITPAPLVNGFGGVRTTETADEFALATSSVPSSKSDSSLPSVGPLSNSMSSTTTTTAATTTTASTCTSTTTSAAATTSPTLLPSVSQNSINLSSLTQPSDLSSSSVSQLSSSLPSHQNSCLPSSSTAASSTSHPHTTVDSPSLQTSAAFSTVATSATSTTSNAVSIANSLNTTNSLGLSSTTMSLPSATTRATPVVSSGKAPPNLPQGVPQLLHNQYIVGPGGILPAYPIYGYDDLQMLQSRLPVDYYGITFPAPAATLTGRDGSLASGPYSGDVTKFARGETASPAPTTTLAQAPQSQTQTHHTAQQPFLNPALPATYSYPGLPYYAGMPGVPSAFQYGPTVFMPPAAAKQHGVNLNASSAPFQQASGYSQHGYGTGVSVASSSAGVPDISGSVYNKAQTFDKQGFHAGTPPPFSLPSALGSTGPLNPGGAPGYAPAPFLHILPAHQQPQSQMLHHHLQQDGQGGSGQRSQQNSMQQKTQANKTTYGNSPYWAN